MTNKTALEKQPRAEEILPLEQRFQPTNLWWFSGTLFASKTLPRELKTREDVYVVMVLGSELGLSVMQSLRSIYVVNGKPSLSADLMGAICQNDERCQYLQLTKHSATECEYKTHRRGQPDPISMSFSIEDARAAGLVEKGGMYEKYPKQMLRARALAQICRAIYPDIVMGLYDPEELATIEPRRQQHEETGVIDAEFVEASGPVDYSNDPLHQEKTRWLYHLVTECGLSQSDGDRVRETLKNHRQVESWNHIPPGVIELACKKFASLSPADGENGEISARAAHILGVIFNTPEPDPEPELELVDEAEPVDEAEQPANEGGDA